MKATEQYFPVVLFIMLYKVVLTFESVDDILKCDHSNETYGTVLLCGTNHVPLNVKWKCDKLVKSVLNRFLVRKSVTQK